jgi:hypothetical protein
MAGTMYQTRQHFIAKLEVALLTWGSIEILESSQIDIDNFQWYLRPHHESNDFVPLCDLVRAAFQALAALHNCKLSQLIRACIVDGKWCIQTTICNARDTGLTWVPALGAGFFKGCVERPLPGNKFCAKHAAQSTLAPEDSKITDR